MLMYFILIAFLLLEGMLFDKRVIIFRGIKQKRQVRIDILFAMAALVIFAGIRNVRLGVDLWNYEDSFRWRSMLTPLEVMTSIPRDRLYHLFAWAVSQFTLNFSIYLFIVACISVIPVGVFIQKYSKIRWLSLWLYVCMGFYTFGFSALRQSIAIGLTVYMLYLIEENCFKKAIIVLLIACGFHNSAIFCVPFFLLKRIKVNGRLAIMITIMAGVAYILRNHIISLGSMIMGKEYGRVQTGGKIWYVALIVMVAFGFIYRKPMWDEEICRHLFLILVAAMIVMPICFSNSVLFRANCYYAIYLCLYIPNMINALHSTEEKWLFICITIFVTMFYFFYKALPGGNIEIYRFMWQQ